MTRTLSLALLLLPATASAAPPATAVAYRPDGSAVAFATGNSLHVFDATGEHRGSVATQRVTALAFAPNGKVLALATAEPGRSGTLALLPVPDGIERLGDHRGPQFAAHKDAIYALAFSPDGRTVATAGYDRVIHLWDVPDFAKQPQKEAGTAKPRLTLKDHSDAVYGLAFHPDGKLLASAGADRAVKVWDAATGTRLYTLGDATDWVYCVAWSADKKHLAAAGVDKSVRVWEANADGGKLGSTAFAHEKPVWRLAFADAGKTLYTVGEDRIVKKWDALKLTETKVFDAQPDALLDFAVRPDGKQLALARFDGANVLLDTATGKATVLATRAKVDPNVKPAGGAQPKDPPPKVERTVPAGAPRGARVTMAVFGSNLESVTAVTASSPEVAVRFDRAQNRHNALAVELTLGARAPVGAVQLTFASPAGNAVVPFAVDHFAAVAEGSASDSARTATEVKLNSTLVGSIDRAGDVDYFRFRAPAGAQIGAQLTASELGSKLDPALVLTDEAGTVVAEGTTALGFTARAAGVYAIGVRDREFRGGTDFAYRLHVGAVPVITGTFPLAAARGRETVVHVSGVNLSASGTLTAKVKVPAEAVPGSKVNVPLPLLAAGGAQVVVSELAGVVIDPTAGADVRVPGAADGIFTKPNEAQTVSFSAKKGERLVLEVLAQRAGSPVDPVLEILDAAGKPVSRATLRCTAKTSVTFRDHDSRQGGIRLDAWNELAIDDYVFVGGELMRILALPRGPDDDCQFYQAGGQRTGFLGTTPVHHFFGEPLYKVELHPPGKTFPPNGMPVFALNYRNDDGGPGFGKDSFVLFDAPADGSYQARVTDARGAHGPAHAFRVVVRAPKPDFGVTASAVGPQLLKGGSVPVNVTVTRADGFDGVVNVRLKNLPAGVSAPPTFVEAGHHTATFPLFADASAALPEKPNVVLVATATIGGKEVAREVPLALPSKLGTGDIVTALRTDALSIRPGGEARFVVEIARQGKFAGRVPIEVKGLPHGVRVLNVGLNGILITERETAREVVLYAEPWVQPQAHPIIVSARREGGSEYGAKPLALTVGK
jgi:hypothetical protein